MHREGSESARRGDARLIGDDDFTAKLLSICGARGSTIENDAVHIDGSLGRAHVENGGDGVVVVGDGALPWRFVVGNNLVDARVDAERHACGTGADAALGRAH